MGTYVLQYMTPHTMLLCMYVCVTVYDPPILCYCVCMYVLQYMTPHTALLCMYVCVTVYDPPYCVTVYVCMCYSIGGSYTVTHTYIHSNTVWGVIYCNTYI